MDNILIISSLYPHYILIISSLYPRCWSKKNRFLDLNPRTLAMNRQQLRVIQVWLSGHIGSYPITLLVSDAFRFIELDDGKILTGKTDQFDGKNPWVSGEDFPNKTNPLTDLSDWFVVHFPLN